MTTGTILNKNFIATETKAISNFFHINLNTILIGSNLVILLVLLFIITRKINSVFSTITKNIQSLDNKLNEHVHKFGHEPLLDKTNDLESLIKTQNTEIQSLKENLSKCQSIHKIN